MRMVARGNTPFFSSRLPRDYLARLDRLALWLHETQGYRLSRRVAIEWLLDRWSDDAELADTA